MYPSEAIKNIRDYMIAQKQSIAVAESVTSGHIQAALSLAEDASKFFQGGITTYNLEQKTKLLHVSYEAAAACNCVCEQVAKEMAQATCKLFACDWAVSITGYAAPDKHNARDYLYAIYAIAHHGTCVKTGTLKAVGNDLLQNQVYYAREVVRALDDHLKTIV